MRFSHGRKYLSTALMEEAGCLVQCTPEFPIDGALVLELEKSSEVEGVRREGGKG
jgi:hypothetical protein